MEGLPKKKEYLRIFLGHHASLEDGQHLLQGLLREVNSNINTFRLHSAHGQANNPAPRKAETKVTNKMH